MMPCLDFAVYKVTCSLARKAGSISSCCYTPCRGGIMDLYHARPLGLSFFGKRKQQKYHKKLTTCKFNCMKVYQTLGLGESTGIITIMIVLCYRSLSNFRGSPYAWKLNARNFFTAIAYLSWAPSYKLGLHQPLHTKYLCKCAGHEHKRLL